MPRMDKLSNYRTTWFAEGTTGGVTYVRTQIVSWTHGTVTLNSGGYETVTTKRKMNQASNQFALGFSVYQQDYQWFVRDRQGNVHEFRDGMTLRR